MVVEEIDMKNVVYTDFLSIGGPVSNFHENVWRCYGVVRLSLIDDKSTQK